MVKHSFFRLPVFWHRHCALVLASSFLLGHLLGVWFSGIASEHYLSAMRAVVSSRVSIIGLLSSMVLPFLFSAFAVYLQQPVLLIPIAFMKAFLFSYLGYGLYTAWGSAAWLVTGLTMFGSLCSMPVLYWYWLRHMGGRRFEILPFCLILGILVMIGMMDYCLIVPFLANIIIF